MYRPRPRAGLIPYTVTAQEAFPVLPEPHAAAERVGGLDLRWLGWAWWSASAEDRAWHAIAKQGHPGAIRCHRATDHLRRTDFALPDRARATQGHRPCPRADLTVVSDGPKRNHLRFCMASPAVADQPKAT